VRPPQRELRELAPPLDGARLEQAPLALQVTQTVAAKSEVIPIEELGVVLYRRRRRDRSRGNGRRRQRKSAASQE
jgi:hypothetical protein